MMPVGNLVRMVAKNTVRSPRHFALSAFGIVIGIAAFVFFLALSLGVREVILKVFPLDVVEVTRTRTTLGGKDVTLPITDETLATVKQSPDVKDAIPRMKAEFPATGNGSFSDVPIEFEVGGFADGINPDYVTDDDRTRELFKDWDGMASDPKRIACEPPPRDPQEEVIQSPPAPKGKASKPGVYYNPCTQPERYYCDEVDRTCHHRVPIVMSPTMIELYNGQFAKSHGLPIADTDFVRFVTQRGGLSAMRFSIGLGLTTIAGSNANISQRKVRRVEAVLVGISDKAMPIGMTMPIGYIQRWNREFLGEEAATAYSSIIVRLKDRNRIAVFSQWLQDELDLRLEDSLGEKFATALFVIRLVLVLISLVIITISSINIAHNFFMQVTERRRELGLLRAVGATQTDVLMVVLGEAALIGLIGGLLGVVLGVAIASGVDWGSVHYLPRFPYKPDSWFHFKWWIVLGGLACSTGFSVFGGYLPARRASTMEPAQALTQN